MKKRFYAILCLIIISCLLFGSCDSGYYVPSPATETEIYKPEGDQEVKPAVVESTVGITLFSWQIPSPSYAEQYCEKIKECGFDCVEIVILWSDIEPEQGVFRFSETDAIIDVFKNAGMKISLSLLFWSERLDWKDALEYQMTADGEIYRYDDVRGSFLAMNSPENLEIVANTLGYFAAHFSDRYEDCLTSWSVRTDCFAKMEYSSLVDLDYSPSAINAFIDYLRGKYENIETLNANFRNHRFR
ncbi:MAG: beta-galactosidase, partial [Clostridia bacterium]|nr:beta-galactosidase [Clostridia bacterium]